MKKTILKASLILSGLFIFSTTKGQWKDSASYKQAVVQYYKQQTTGDLTYRYVPRAYTQLEQDTLFSNALAWKKINLDYPLLLNYFKIKKGTPAAEAKLRYLEDTASTKEYSSLLTKAVAQHAAENKKTPKKYASPGIKTLPSKSGGEIQNRDKQIKEEVLKNWKF